MKKLTLGALVAIATTASGFAQAGYQAKPGTFDPDKTGIVTAAWINKLGLPDSGGSSFGLLLAKDGPSSTNAAAGAAITGVAGITLTEAGYDYKTGGHCGAGSPRFNVVATDGFHFLGGCSNGTPSLAAAGWTRVRFDPNNPTQCFPVIGPTATILSITLLADEGTDVGPGNTIVDNIDINGTLIDKPGSAK